MAMGKTPLSELQIGAAILADPGAVVESAAETAAKLTAMRSRGPGDLDNAMRSAARVADVPYSVLWRLRYRRGRVKDVGTSVFFKLQSAYRTECERQMRKLENEISVARRVGAADDDLRKAEAVVGHAVPSVGVRSAVQTPRERLGRTVRRRP